MLTKGALFIGSKQLGLCALRTLADAIPEQILGAVTIDDTSDGRSVLSQFQSYCAQSSLPLVVLNHQSELGEVIQRYAPEYVLVVGWYWILPPHLLTLVPHGFLGAHASLLPKYRGNAPLVWAILRGEKETGVTLFFFDTGMDTGDIVGQRAFAIDESDSIGDVLAKAECATSGLISTYAKSLLDGTAPHQKQDHDLATYGSLRRPEDGLINWNQSAQVVYNFIRAQTKPYPGAFTFLPDDRALRIWRASIFPRPYYGVPGLVAQKHEDGVIVNCYEGAIVVHECEVESGRTVIASTILKWGMRLGG